MKPYSDYRKPAATTPTFKTEAQKAAKITAEVVNQIKRDRELGTKKEVDKARSDLPGFYNACIKRIYREAKKGNTSIIYDGEGSPFFSKWNKISRSMLWKMLRSEGFSPKEIDMAYNKNVNYLEISWGHIKNDE